MSTAAGMVAGMVAGIVAGTAADTAAEDIHTRLVRVYGYRVGAGGHHSEVVGAGLEVNCDLSCSFSTV